MPSKGPGIAFLAVGIAFLGLGASGRTAFVAIGLAFLALGTVFLVRARRGTP